MRLWTIGSGHYEAHKNMEAFWKQYRKGGNLYGERPTIGAYNRALYNSLKAAGLENKKAEYAVRRAYSQQQSYGLLNRDLVPRIPGRITHSSVGDFTYNPKTGAVSKMKGGGHGQANIEFLEANGLEYNIVKVYDNGVRVGVIRTNGRISTIFPDAASQP